MVLDSSAVIAILLGEPEARTLAEKMDADPRSLIGAPTALESAIVIEARKGVQGGRELDELLLTFSVEIVPATADHFRLAREAWRRYGKGRHPAHLNLCDCLAYALAKATGEPLLFVGDDFVKTDITPA
jgi:ribonuclease VapC